MEKLMEVLEREVAIEFRPMAKCRTEIHVRSLHPTDAIAFKVQSTSPARFHVTPPAGILRPLATAALRVTLRPQSHLPPSSDRFLIRASLDSDIQDTKLSVSYINPSEVEKEDISIPEGEFSYFNPLFRIISTKKQKAEESHDDGQMVMTAARRGDLAQLEMLMRRRIGIHSRDQYKMTALHCAAIKGHWEAVSFLVGFGIEIESQDAEGHTPLHLAVEGGCAETTELLINLGADVNARSNRGATPLYIARSMGHEPIVDLLISRGAHPLPA